MIIAQSILISANVLEVHSFEFAHNLAEIGAPVWVIIPTPLHQLQEGPWGVSLGYLGSEAFLDNTLTDNLAIDAIVGRLSSGELPHDDSEREDIGLLRVLEAFDDLWSHPLVRANLRCHDLGLDTSPPKVCQLGCQSMV